MATAGLTVLTTRSATGESATGEEAGQQPRSRTACPTGPLPGSQRLRSLSSTLISRSKAISTRWVRARAVMPSALVGLGSSTEARAGLRWSPRSTCSLTKARGRGPHTELRRLHSSRFSPPTQTHRTKQDITRKDAGKLDQRLAQGQQTQTSPRSPEQPLPKISISVQTTLSKKPNYFEPLILHTKQPLFCFFV